MKAARLLGAICLAAGMLAGALGPAPPPACARDDRFSDALEEIRQAEPASERVRLCRQLLAENPPAAVTALCRTVLALEAAQPDSAQRWSERFFAADAYVGPGGLLLVEELDRGLKVSFAMRVLRRAVERAPDEAVLQARLGAMNLLLGDTTRAELRAEAVAGLHGDFIASARRLVRTYAGWERIPEAVVLLYRLAPRAETAAEYASIQRDLGFAALGLGDTLQARVSLGEAAAWAPSRETADALRLLGILRTIPEAQRRERARARAEAALGWTLAPSPDALRRLERMRMDGESSLARERASGWSRPQ